MTKAMWNPGITGDEILKDYCDSAFHEASEPMRAFFLTFESGQQAADHTSTGIWTAFTPKMLKQAREYMDKALATARGEIVKRRLAALDAHFKFAEQGYEVYVSAQQTANKHDEQLLKRATKLARQAEEQFEKTRQTDPECVDIILPARQLNRMLKLAGAAIKKPQGGKPVRIDADHRN